MADDFDWSSLEISTPINQISSTKQARIKAQLHDLTELGYIGQKDLNELEAELREEKRKFKAVEDAARRAGLRSGDVLSARRLQAEKIARLDAQFKATVFAQEAQKIARDISITWAKAIAEISALGGIQTDAQFLKQVARLQDALSQTILGASNDSFNKMLEKVALDDAYFHAITRLQNSQFTLWVNDPTNTNPAIPSDLLSKERLMGLARILQGEAQKIIYLALHKAIDECVKGLDNIAWPPKYTRLMHNAVASYENQEVFKLSGTPSLASFRVSLDFFDIFGVPHELSLAYHRGALTKEGNRVELPWTSEVLKNDVRKRYLFWVSVAYKKRIFYGNKDNRPNKRQAIKKIARGLEGKAKRYQSYKEDLLSNRANPNRRERAGKDFRDLGQLRKELLDRDERIEEASNAAEYSKFRAKQLRKNRDLQGIKIRNNAWEDTITDRVNTWAKIGKAPIWIYLEFGQLRWKPVIPPRGLTYRFLVIARAMLDQRVREIMDKELAAAGIYRTPTGKMLATGEPIRFGAFAGLQQRKGTQLSSKAIGSTLRAIRDHELIVTRNANDARAIYNAPPLQPRKYSAVDEFWRKLQNLDIIDRETARTVTPNEQFTTYTTPTLLKKMPGVSRVVHGKVYSPLGKTSSSRIPTAKSDPNSFGNRMASLAAKRKLEADMRTAHSLGEDVFTYRKRIQREALARQKAETKAKAAAKRKRDRDRIRNASKSSKIRRPRKTT